MPRQRAACGGNDRHTCNSRDNLQFSQDANATVRSTVEAYLRLPLEEFRCLRFILAQHYLLCNRMMQVLSPDFY